MNKICTDIEQSKKLIELGIDVDTADMCHRYRWSNNSFMHLPCAEKAREPRGSITGDIPAWSLSALLELMPTFTLNGYGNGQFNCRDERADNYSLVDTCPLDAAFEMVAWLKENNKL